MLNSSESTSSIISAKRATMKKIIKEKRTSQDSYEKLCQSFETASKLKPSHRMHRQASLTKLKEEFNQGVALKM